MHNSEKQNSKTASTVAYLIVQEVDERGKVYRLVDRQVTTIGRAPTNRIVLDDEVCSRSHCEIFYSDGGWYIRDLGSRNGTLVQGLAISQDHRLQEGDVVEIGDSEAIFTFDVSRFSSRPTSDGSSAVIDSETMGVGQQSSWDELNMPEIVQRKSHTRFHTPPPASQIDRDRASRELGRLYRLALEMGNAQSEQELCQIVLNGLFEGTSADIGAILNLDPSKSLPRKPENLRVIAFQSVDELPYRKPSDYLSRMVFDEGDALLAHNIADDSKLSTRDSLGKIHAQSVICAPLRNKNGVAGLIHLYSTNPDNPLDSEDLEFTLALADQLAVSLQNLSEKLQLSDGLARMEGENKALREQLELESELVGQSPSMVALKEQILRIAPTDASVLIRGESGVGKELVARAIHFNSQRKKQPFVCMNCAALSEGLLESELFGHEKGAFTGATSQKPGKFEQAHRGSLFLDEVGEMSLAVQAKFLRVLEGHSFERVGGSASIDVDVRVVAATNRDMEKAVAKGTFRQDLYFRLHVVEVSVDPLRVRADDILLLANYFLNRFVTKTGRPIRGFTDQAKDLLESYHWPGNVRELQNTIERAFILCTSDVVDAEDIQLSAVGMESDPQSVLPAVHRGFREVSLEEVEQEHILAVLNNTNWNKSRSAQILGIERSTLDRKLKRYGISRP
ncbi:MAG: sigma 54-interacting transcriptional regulator [Gimesia chilikensis]|uniref:sigma 54-interacting transcriptional regulator n=1 Tax=Gimesia chilikensis TaxID=2605989 RepID=UPI0011EFBA9A|nr:sigma 54-interacting transcriptional regulator [Gimesia chilikensis]KAA0137684.1 FHA domain-containing protein [Gimesia chilikensis]